MIEQGMSEAQLNLGVMYYDGDGVSEDYEAALRWLSLAAGQRNDSAQVGLGVMYEFGYGVPQNDVYAYMWYDIAAESGSEDAQEYRDEVAERLSSGDLSNALRLARECVNQDYKGC